VYPFVLVDALVVKVRRDDAVRATSALIVSGVNDQGRREVLGLRSGDSESEGTWADMFAWLKRRGLRGVEVLVSDDHAGLVKAAQRYFQGVLWQRCQVHLGHHVLGRTPRHQVFFNGVRAVERCGWMARRQHGMVGEERVEAMS
jgi:putative transposase